MTWKSLWNENVFTLQGHSVCRGMGIINTNIHLVLSEYFVSTFINECPGENVKSVPLSEAIDLLTDHFIPFDNE